MFDLDGAVPGGYSSFTSIKPPEISPQVPVPVATGSAPPTPELGYLVVDMGNSDLENVRITTTSGWTIPARVTIEGRTVGNDPDMNRLRITFTRDPDNVGSPA